MDSGSNPNPYDAVATSGRYSVLEVLGNLPLITSSYQTSTAVAVGQESRATATQTGQFRVLPANPRRVWMLLLGGGMTAVEYYVASPAVPNASSGLALVNGSLLIHSASYPGLTQGVWYFRSDSSVSRMLVCVDNG